ncbi:MAG: phage tail spike protein [Peptoniphilaceae bacterium]
MRKYNIVIYDSNMKKLAYLDKAYDVWYELKLNELWTCGFKLPARDKKTKYCKVYNYVELFDGNKRVELFRIMPTKLMKDEKTYIEYECEHVLSTLFDDVLFQYHQIGNLGVYTKQVIRYVLDKQTIKRWQLSQCDFERQFEYKWENENLLAALFSISQPFLEKYRWEFETTSFPWRISLKKLNDNYKADIQYKKNLNGIVKTEDPSNLITRLYLLGYGEGDNQLNVTSINNGLPYIERNVGKYGLKSSILTDRRFENEETLLAYGKKILKEASEPYVSYEINSFDLNLIDNKKYQRFFPGDNILVRDREDNIDLVIPVISVKKTDVTGNNMQIELEVANKKKNISGTISELQNRARINDTYSQGATNLQQIAFVDNADSRYPAKFKFYVPAEMARINKLILNYTIEPFRAYSKATKGGGSQVDTTESGGGDYTSTGGGGGGYTTTGGGGGAYDTTHGMAQVNGGNVKRSVFNWQHQNIGYAEDYHVNHHEHSIQLREHSHSVSIPQHSHSVSISSHRHAFTLPDHTHEIDYGINQGSSANKAYIRIDGRTVYDYEQEVNIIPYLSKDDGGKIQRGTWHVVEIVPDKLTRINASLFIQLFVNSRGGGDY